jgi:hypothetical protein
MKLRKKRPQRKAPSRSLMMDHIQSTYYFLNQGELSTHYPDVDLDSLSYIELNPKHWHYNRCMYGSIAYQKGGRGDREMIEWERQHEDY